VDNKDSKRQLERDTEEMIRTHVEVPGTDRKTQAMASIIVRVRKPGEVIQRILVVGCGDGREARDLAKIFHAKVDAIDIDDRFIAHDPDVTFHQMDAEILTFSDASFDLVFSFHALEHIPNPTKALVEMRRVLRDGHIFIIGVPNRYRLVAYMTGRDATFSQKIIWNLMDWKAKLQGRFRNELGAHAGFTHDELWRMTGRIGFSQPATRLYYNWLYPKYRPALAAIVHLGLWQIIFPCAYIVGRKTDAPAFRLAS
jgi:SAM-dependent methyltransferase